METTPYEIWNGKKPDISFLKIWGCDAYVKRLQPNKLDPKADKCYFVGYAKDTVGYSFYHPSDGKVFIAKGGTFPEKEVSGRTVQLDEISESSEPRTETIEVVPPVISMKEPVAPALDTGTSKKLVTEPRR